MPTRQTNIKDRMLTLSAISRTFFVAGMALRAKPKTWLTASDRYMLCIIRVTLVRTNMSATEWLATRPQAATYETSVKLLSNALSALTVRGILR